MKMARPGKIINIWFAICTIAFLAAGFFPDSPVNAQGGLGFSGTFNGQIFEIPQGSSVSAPSIDVVVFNQGDEIISINMSSQAPAGVNIILSETVFDLAPHTYKSLSVDIDVTAYAALGDHQIIIIAQSYTTGVAGIQLLGSASQSANLKITGESGTISVQATSPDGTPVPATIRLFRQIGSNKYELAYSETGILNATVSPGSYVVEGYVGGELLDEESFDIAADETKSLTLTVGTIYFSQFDVLEYSNTDTGEFAYAEMVYTVRNVYEQVDNVSIWLEVKYDNESLEQRMIDPPNTLSLEGANRHYPYIPIDGWSDGNYSFKLILKIDNETYTSSAERQLDVGGGNEPSDKENDSNMPLIVGIVCAVVLLLDIAFYMIYRSRKSHLEGKRTHPKTKKQNTRGK